MKHWLLVLMFAVLSVNAQAEDEESTSPTQSEEDASPVVPPEEERTLTVDEILAETLDEADYTDGTRCLDLRRMSDTRILDRQHVAFRASRSTYYIIRLTRPCPGLDRDDLLVMRSRSERLCRLDSFTAVDRASGMPGARCVVDSIQNISAEQYQFLRRELKRNR